MPLKLHEDEPPAMNLIPMIDIMFVVILFFLVTSRFASIEHSIALRVPEVVGKGALTEAPAPVVINVYADRQVTLADYQSHDETAITLTDLTSLLARKRDNYPDQAVLVRGDKQAPFQWVAEVLNACKQAGIRELGISVRVMSSEP